MRFDEDLQNNLVIDVGAACSRTFSPDREMRLQTASTITESISETPCNRMFVFHPERAAASRTYAGENVRLVAAPTSS